MQNPRLTIIVPCYNEEAVLPKSAHILDGILTDLISNTNRSMRQVSYYLLTMVVKIRLGN